MWRALLMGFGVGFVLVLLLVLVHGRLYPSPDGFVAVVIKAFIIYGATGFVAGRAVGPTLSQRGRGGALQKAALHGLAAGSLLTLVHGLVIVIARSRILPSPWWFVLEALAAAVLAALAGSIGARSRRYASDAARQASGEAP